MRNMVPKCFLILIMVFGCGKCNMKFSETSISMLVNETKTVELYVENTPDLVIRITASNWDILKISPNVINSTDAPNPLNETQIVEIKALLAGETLVFAASDISLEYVYLPVQVYKNQLIKIISIIMGWGYILVWLSLSLYPQVYENYKRKSVVGLSFDYLAINLTGCFCRAAFTIGLIYIQHINIVYIVGFSTSNVFYCIHGIILTVFTCLQCFWYDRGGQKISWFGKVFHYVTAIIIIVSIGLSIFNVMDWLDFLDICSYVESVVTVCKYGPQALMNYQRQSTSGWSIGNVLLDLAGGILSILQMFLHAYNDDQWEWILENPTILVFGILTLVFGFVFMVQHYCLYKVDGNKKKKDCEIEMDVVEKTIILPVT